jgi:putative copper resistance protein D
VDNFLILLRAVARGFHIAGYFSAYGTYFVAAVLLHRTTGLKRLAWGCSLLAVLAGAVWFWLQSADFAGAYDVSDVLAALPIVATNTRFGFLLLARSAVLILAALCFQCGARRLAVLLGGAGVAAESWLGHGGAMDGTEGKILLLTSIAHLLAAATWLGGLPALFVALKRLPLAEARALGQKFSPYGIICVVVLLATALIQYLTLIGRLNALFTSAYGLTALFKILSLAALIALAALNRIKLVPALTNEAGRKALRRSISAEIVLGLATFLAAGLILQLTPPGMAYMVGH